jgi:hypothetical protein
MRYAHRSLTPALAPALAQDNIGAACALAREYDMPAMLDSAEDWLVDATTRGAVLGLPLSSWQSCSPLPSPPPPPPRPASHVYVPGGGGATSAAAAPVKRRKVVPPVARFVRTLALAREFKLRRFADACNKRVNQLTEAQARLVLVRETEEALK